jgi:hypothetical protein
LKHQRLLNCTVFFLLFGSVRCQDVALQLVRLFSAAPDTMQVEIPTLSGAVTGQRIQKPTVIATHPLRPQSNQCGRGPSYQHCQFAAAASMCPSPQSSTLIPWIDPHAVRRQGVPSRAPGVCSVPEGLGLWAGCFDSVMKSGDEFVQRQRFENRCFQPLSIPR